MVVPGEYISASVMLSLKEHNSIQSCDFRATGTWLQIYIGVAQAYLEYLGRVSF